VLIGLIVAFLLLAPAALKSYGAGKEVGIYSYDMIGWFSSDSAILVCAGTHAFLVWTMEPLASGSAKLMVI
jgi:hypothetical protein